MKLLNLWPELRAALLYAAFGGLWILFSDRLLETLTSDIATLSRLQTYKGWAFVAASALLIFTLLRRELKLRRRSEGEFQESEERYRLLFENSLDAILLCTPEGDILSANPPACRMFERSEPELVQLGLNGLANVTLPRRQATWRQRLQSGDLRHEELILSRRGGTSFPAEVSTVSFRDRDGQARTSLIIRDITGRRQAERALRESERHYRLISENIADVIWTLDPATGRFTYVSPSVYHLRGLRPEQVMAEPMQAALTPESYRFVAERLPARLAAFQAGDGTARTAIDEVDQTRSDGSIVPTEVVTTLITDDRGRVVEILGVTREISERREAEAQIRRQLKHLSSLHAVDLAISSSFDLGVVFDIVLGQLTTHLDVDAAVLLVCNPQLQIMEYGSSRGLGPGALQAAKGTAGHERARRVMLERRTLHHHLLVPRGGETVITLQLGDETFAEYYGVPLIAKGEIKGVLEVYQRRHRGAGPDWLQFLETLAGQIAIAIDNTQLFNSLQRANLSLERRVAERTAELHRANLELAHASQAKDEFLATMSHELRTPLNSILGLTESLLEFTRGPLNDHQQKYLHTIDASARHLFELISDILDISRIEAGKADYLPQSVRVEELCRSSLAFISSQAARKSLSLAYQNEAQVPHLMADPRRLKQILINLLTNAVKFTPARGHVTLQVQTNVEEGRICFSVSDDGIGIAPADLPRLFRPFVQLDGSLNRQHGGTGLGLALVQKLTDLHGGSVQVESTPGQGSRFTVCLPIGLRLEQPGPAVDALPAGSELQQPPAPLQEPARREGMPPRKVLVVEDHEATLLLLSEYLGRAGYDVATACNGAAAIEQAQLCTPDLILLDIQMPVMDGLETMAILRKDPRFATTPIVALTALAMSGDRERCLSAGASEYLSKPVSLKTLSETIEKLLQKA